MMKMLRKGWKKTSFLCPIGNTFPKKFKPPSFHILDVNSRAKTTKNYWKSFTLIKNYDGDDDGGGMVGEMMESFTTSGSEAVDVAEWKELQKNTWKDNDDDDVGMEGRREDGKFDN